MYRISHLLNKWSLEHFFALWFVLGTVWIFESRFGSFRDASKFQVVYIILLAWNAMPKYEDKEEVRQLPCVPYVLPKMCGSMAKNYI
ncbi:hypothetical protein JHK82_025240 [Glycine max]|nr:hypothetical protein JHK86_025362 [Glycine max]KAG5134052.1 hypothetical protein JHK82_025240 [Glycine max]